MSKARQRQAELILLADEHLEERGIDPETGKYIGPDLKTGEQLEGMSVADRYAALEKEQSLRGSKGSRLWDWIMNTPETRRVKEELKKTAEDLSALQIVQNQGRRR